MGKALKDRKLKFETLQLHVGQEEADPVTGARAVPIYQTSSYVFNNSEHAAARFGLTDAGNIYGRLTNPTEDVFEQRIAALEGGVAALAVASGAAAIAYTLQNLAHAGEHIVAANNIYGGTYNLLAHTFPEYGITTTFVDPFNYDEVEQAIQENTRAIHIETLGNPNSDVVDIEKFAAIAHAHQIPLVVDNSLVTAYNNYYYTEYKTLDPALVSFSGPLHFVAGAQDSETPVIVGITDMTALGDEEYLVPVRVDFSKHSGFSANTDKEVCYLKLKTKQQVCVLSLPGMEQVTEISVMQGEDGMVIEKKGYTLQLQASIGVPVDSKFSIVADPALVDSYNKQHGTKYTPMSANDVTLPDELLLPKNSQATTPVEIKAVDYEKLTSDGSMVVLKVDLGGNADFNTIGDKDVVKFVVFKKMEGNIEENATRVPGTVIADMSGWTYDAPGAEGLVSSQMFDGAIAMNQSGWYITNGSVTATVDMVNVHTLAGFRIRPMYGLGYYKVLRLYDVKTSEDGQHWVSQSGDSFVSLALSGDDWQYVKFYKPVSCRFVRMTYRCDKESASNSYVGCNEFNAIASN